MKSLKVYGLNLFIPKQKRCIVAASSQIEAAKLMNVSVNYVRGYGAVTGNERELKRQQDAQEWFSLTLREWDL